MNVLFSLDNYDHGSGGAEASARDLAAQLCKRGHSVGVLQQGDSAATYERSGVRVHSRTLPQRGALSTREHHSQAANRAWRDVLGAHLDEHPAELIVTHAMLLPATVEVARARGIPVAAFVRAYRAFCPTQFQDRDPMTDCSGRCLECLPWHRRWEAQAIRRGLDDSERGLRDATVVFANSRYVQSVIHKFLGIEAHVVYPSIDPARYAEVDAPGDAVLFVKPQQVKGLSVFLDVAQRMPETRFVVAGKTRRRVRRALGGLPNVEMLGWVEDMRRAYARARVLMAPSLWPEPFGRVFAEAGAAGLPSVASARGGIPEAVGDGGILVPDVTRAEPWIEALRRLEDAGTWAAYSARARAQAQRFSGDAAVTSFAGAIRESTGLEL